MRKLYMLDTRLDDADDWAMMLEENMIAIPYGETGDLQDVDVATILGRLVASRAVSGAQIEEALQVLNTFIHDMSDGDWVLIGSGADIYLGDIGTYFYNTTSPSADKGWRHQRGVTWLARLADDQLPPMLGEALAADKRLAVYPCTAEEWAKLERLVFNRDTTVNLASKEMSDNRNIRVPADLVDEALAVLREALRSDDPLRREQAAIAILNYAK